MKLKEIRRFVKLTENFSDDTTLFLDFCGYTSDDEWFSGFDYDNDGETDTLNINIKGTAYSMEVISDKSDEECNAKVRSAYHRWLDVKRVACRKPVEVLKNKLKVPADFVFEVRDVVLISYNNTISLTLAAKVVLDDGTRNDRSVIMCVTVEDLDLNFYDCEDSEPTTILEHKSDTPKVFADGRKVYQSTFEIL